jgi:hypothetical protein
MGHLGVPLKAVYPFWAQAANHPLPGDLAYADGSSIAAANQAIVNGSSYTLPDLRNKHIIGADRAGAVSDGGQYISYVINCVASANSYYYVYVDWGIYNWTISSTDYLCFDQYWPSANVPASGSGFGAVSIIFSDGTGWGNGVVANPDQNGILYNGDVRAYALDQWYSRRISLSTAVGKAFYSFALANDYDGTFANCTARLSNIYIGDSSGNVKLPLWMAGDGTPTVTTYLQSTSTFVSANASTLGAPGPDGIGGTNGQIMKARCIPSHGHTASTGSAGDHAHSTSVTGHGSHTHTVGGNIALSAGNASYNSGGSTHAAAGCLGSTNSSTGSHGHTVSPGNDGAHEHNVTTNASTGTAARFDNRPRYLSAVWCVKSGLPTARLQSIPLGAIIMWYADNQNETLPTGFSFLDGSSLTSGNHTVPNQSGSTAYTLVLPDTRNRYLIGADRTKAFGAAGVSASDLPTDAPGPGATGGTHVATIAATNLPPHAHPATTTTGNPWAAHNHSWSVTANGNHAHGSVQYNIASWNAGSFYTIPGGGLLDDIYENDTTTISSTSTNDGHSHTFSIGITGAHSHTVTVNNAGSGTSWDGRVPFLGIVHLMRTNIGYLSCPLKTVVAFRATTSNESLVPTDGTWALCDGSTLTAGQFDMAANSGANYVLPNFKKFFPLGADRTKVAGNAGGTTDVATDAPGPKGTSGTDMITVTTSIMPSHGHTASTDSQGNHDHGTSVTTSPDGGHAHGTGCQSFFVTATLHVGVSFSTSGNLSTPAPATTTTTFASATQPAHGTSCSTAGAHTHTVAIPNAGAGAAMQQRPRHHGLVFYMKVKR